MTSLETTRARLTLKSIDELMGESFVIPSYQRGYRLVQGRDLIILVRPPHSTDPSYASEWLGSCLRVLATHQKSGK